MLNRPCFSRMDFHSILVIIIQIHLIFQQPINVNAFQIPSITSYWSTDDISFGLKWWLFFSFGDLWPDHSVPDFCRNWLGSNLIHVPYYSFRLHSVLFETQVKRWTVESVKIRIKDAAVCVCTRARACVCVGVFLVTTKNAFLPVKFVYSMNTYSWISMVPRGSEQSERARERSEREKRA